MLQSVQATALHLADLFAILITPENQHTPLPCQRAGVLDFGAGTKHERHVSANFICDEEEAGYRRKQVTTYQTDQSAVAW